MTHLERLERLTAERLKLAQDCEAANGPVTRGLADELKADVVALEWALACLREWRYAAYRGIGRTPPGPQSALPADAQPARLKP